MRLGLQKNEVLELTNPLLLLAKITRPGNFSQNGPASAGAPLNQNSPQIIYRAHEPPLGPISTPQIKARELQGAIYGFLIGNRNSNLTRTEN
jgi:hypothetical protein